MPPFLPDLGDPVATFDFVPTTNATFTFQPTLDGQVYNVIVTWNLFGQRFYVNIYELGGALVVSLPLIGSPLDYDISLTAGYFTSKMVYRQQSRQFQVTP